MLTKYYITLILCVSIHRIVNCDCGCNRKERSEIVIEKRNNEQVPSNDECPEPKKSQLLHFIRDEMSKIDAGHYLIGTNEPIFHSDREMPEHIVQTNGFYIDKFEVSNAEFSKFIDDTGYVTYAEKFSDSFVFQEFLSKSLREIYRDYRVANAIWWYKINNTFWKQPNGPESSIDDRMNHPVVHVSWFDAQAYCKWKSKRLPTEIEWEIACRGGKKSKLYPWGNKLMPQNKHWLNIWQGEFPAGNTADDGYQSTCPVDQFKQNDFGLYNIVGNVWEWVDTNWRDDEANVDSNTIEKVKKGGSYLCHKSYCYRYRCAARSSNTADSSAGNLGFRCAMN